MGCMPSIIDYDYSETTVNITGYTFGASELLRVTVPSLPYAVRLYFEMFVARVSGAATVGASVAIIPASATVNPVLSALNSDRASGLTTPAGTYLGVKMMATAHLRANSPGDYIVAGTNLVAGDVAAAYGTPLVPSQFWALR